MSQKANFISALVKEIGYVEGPKNNETKFGAFTKANFLPWCGSLIMWAANEVRLKIPNVVGTAAGAEKFKGIGRWKNSDNYKPQIGDLAFFDFPNDGVDRISHIGLVVTVKDNGLMEVVEGNTTPDGKKGSQRNGGEVALKLRAWKVPNSNKLPVYVIGYGLPKYKD